MKLAVAGRVSAIKPIDGADRIQQAQVDCGDEGSWSGVVSKEINEGDAVVVFLQDALLPTDNPRWAFMEKSKWRVRMARFKGVPSECLIIPAVGIEANLEPGFEVGDVLGVTKYEKPVSAQIAGEVRGNFPSFIPKTDEPNFQRVRDLRELMLGWDWVATVKYDGTSCTAWVDDEGELHVCSRNLELKEFSDSGASNVYWQAARKFDLDLMTSGFALQFEVCGPGIQGNPCGYDDLEIRAFTLYDINRRERCHFGALVHFCDSLGIPMAEISASGHGYVDADQLRMLADAVVYENGKQGEGVVVRSINSNWSFKSISLSYKD
jgi:RNA ligase (TIGR02306 family)